MKKFDDKILAVEKKNVTTSKCREEVRAVVIIIYRLFLRFLHETIAERPTESKYDGYVTKSNEQRDGAKEAAIEREI